jgi:hypothetical protein
MAGGLGALGNVLSQLGGAVQNAPQAEQQKELQKLQLQQQKELLPLQTEAYKQQILQQQQDAAGKQYDMYGQALLRNPALASNGQFIAKLQGVAQVRDIPLQLTPDGKVDSNQFKTPWDQLDEKTQQAIISAPPGPDRDALLTKYSNVPDDVRTAQQYVTAKDNAALQRAGAYVKNEADMAKFRAQRNDIEQAKLHVSQGLATARETELLARADKDRQDAIDGHMRVQAYVQGVQARMTINTMRLQQLQNTNDRFAFTTARTSAKQIEDEYKSLERQRDVVQNQLGTYLQNGGEPDDATATAMSGSLKSLNDQLNDQKNVGALTNAQQFLSKAQNPSWVSSQLSGSSGVPVTTNGGGSQRWTPPAGAVEGMLKDGTDAWQTPDGAIYNSSGKRLN